MEASCGTEALAALDDQECSVVLLDLNMPGMSGEDVLERLPPDAPRIVLLTSASTQEAGRVLGSGPHYYLPKGASREQLSMMLQSLALAA